MTPEQQKAIALANARKRKAEAMGGAQAAPPMSTRATEQFPPQEGLGNMSVPVPYPQRAGDLQGVRDYLSQSQAEDDARAAEREALRKRAAEAGRAETLRGLQSTSPMAMGLGGPSAALAGQSASDQVYGEAGVMSPEAATEVRGFNSALMGLPGLLNESARERIGQAGQDQPGAALLGDIAGYLVPGEALWQAGKGLTNAFARPIVSRVMPQGGSAIERGTRFAGRYGTQTGAWAGQNALYQGTVGESVRAAEEGRAPTLANAAGGAVTGATDWLNLAGPAALMGLNRGLKWLRTGGASATPDDVAASVSAATSGRSNSAQSSASQVLGMDLASDIRPQAVDRIVRTLSRANMSSEDITRLFESVQQRLSSLPEAQARRLTLGQALLDALEDPEISQSAGRYAQAAFNLRGILRGASQGGKLGELPRRGDERAGIIAGVRTDLQGSQTDFVMDSARQNLGDPNITDVRGQLEAERTRLSNEYERLFNEAGTQQPVAVRGDDISWSGAAPMEPQGLLGFIRERGGLRESFGMEGRGYMRGTVQQILGDVRKRPGLLNNKTGQTIDELTRDAQERGFDIRDDDEFVRLLADELQGGSKTYRIGEAEEWEAYQSFLRSRPKADAAFEALPPEIQDLSNVVSFYISKPSLMKEIRAIADAEMVDLEQMVQQDPRRAAHWLQRAAREKAEEAKDKGNRVLARAYGRMRSNLLGPLEQAVPGYRDVRGQFGSAEEIDRSLSIGRRFLSKTERPEDLSEFVSELNGLSPEARSAALASIRDEVGMMLGRGGEDASARITQLTSANALRTLEALGPEGKALADDLRFMRREQRFIGNTIYGSDTFRNLKASESEALGNTALTNAVSGQGGMGQALATDAMFAAATQTPVPLVSGFKALGQGISNAFKPRVETLNDEVRFLMSRRGNVPEVPGAPDFSAPPPRPENAFAQTMSNQQTVPSQNAFAQSVLGGAGGSAYGSQNDINGDGVIDEQDVFLGSAAGTVGVPAASALMRRGGNAFAPQARSMGADVPKTPQQAMRAELPGSPEYEAAVAKGLDMSTEARMARAREMGFDTDTVLYHGTANRDFDEFENGVVFTTSDPEIASAYAYRKARSRYADEGPNREEASELERLRDLQKKRFALTPDGRKDENNRRWAARDAEVKLERELTTLRGGQIMPVYARAKNPLIIDNVESLDPTGDIDSGVIMRRLVAKAKSEGHDGLIVRGWADSWADKVGDYHVIFDPANIRSVHAAFDPDKAASPILTAGLGGAGPKVPAHGYDELRIGQASVEVTRIGDEMTINRLKVPETARGQGEASKALQEVLRQADAEGLTVYLTADPVGSGGLNKTQLEAFYKRNGFVSDGGDGMIRPPRQAQTMGFGAGGRKPPKDSPEAITEAVRGISRSVPPTPPGGPVIPPRGNMRGVLQAPERVPPASPMADQVPPPLPPRPVSNRVPTSNMPNATEMGLMAGTGAAIGGAFLMEKANDPATFGLASFDQLPPDHPLRDPNYRRMALMAQMQPQQSQNAFASARQ